MVWGVGAKVTILALQDFREDRRNNRKVREEKKKAQNFWLYGSTLTLAGSTGARMTLGRVGEAHKDSMRVFPQQS